MIRTARRGTQRVMTNETDVYDVLYLRSAVRGGALGTPIAFDEVPRVERLINEGYVTRLPANAGRIYGSAVATPKGVAWVAAQDSDDEARKAAGMTVLEALESSKYGHLFYDKKHGFTLFRGRHQKGEDIRAKSLEEMAEILNREP